MDGRNFETSYKHLCRFEEHLHNHLKHNLVCNFFFFLPTVCLGTESELVYFTSRNFNNTLHWVPAVPAVPGENITAKYSVEYKM